MANEIDKIISRFAGRQKNRLLQETQNRLTSGNDPESKISAGAKAFSEATTRMESIKGGHVRVSEASERFLQEGTAGLEEMEAHPGLINNFATGFLALFQAVFREETEERHAVEVYGPPVALGKLAKELGLDYQTAHRYYLQMIDRRIIEKPPKKKGDKFSSLIISGEAAEFLGLLVEHIGPPRPGKRTNMDRTFSWLEAEIQKTKMTKIGSLTPSHKHARGWNVDAGTADIDIDVKPKG